jgi:site-specific DNA-cytosine methylase
MKPKHLDLFTGLGSFSLGARWSGYETIAHSEIEPFCTDLLAKRFPEVANLGDVRKLCRLTSDCLTAREMPDVFDPDTVDSEFDDAEPGCFCPVCSEESGFATDFGDCDCIGATQFADEHGYPDLLTAGSPCQDFSLAGKGAGISGARSGLIMEIPRIAAVMGVPFCILENVPGILARGFDDWCAAMEAIGHTVATVCVQAAAFGFSHGRERVFAVTHHPGIGVEGLWTPGIQEPCPLDRAQLSVRHRDGQWKAEPDLRRDPDGFPPGLDRSAAVNPRLKALGNSLPPQIAACLMDFIRHYATTHRHLFTTA